MNIYDTQSNFGNNKQKGNELFQSCHVLIRKFQVKNEASEQTTE